MYHYPTISSTTQDTLVLVHVFVSQRISDLVQTQQNWTPYFPSSNFGPWHWKLHEQQQASRGGTSNKEVLDGVSSGCLVWILFVTIDLDFVVPLLASEAGFELNRVPRAAVKPSYTQRWQAGTSRWWCDVDLSMDEVCNTLCFFCYWSLRTAEESVTNLIRCTRTGSQCEMYCSDER